MIATSIDEHGRCRWSTNKGEPLLFVKYDPKKLNMLDVETGALHLKDPVLLEKTKKCNIASFFSLFHLFLSFLFLSSFGFPLIGQYLLLIDYTSWIDVCPSDGSLLAAGGQDTNVNIFDKRESKIIKTLTGIHESKRKL